MGPRPEGPAPLDRIPSLSAAPTHSGPPPQPLPAMCSLQELCSGLPLRPLPENRGRRAGVPHAPVRTPGLSPAEEQVRGWAPPRPAGLLSLWEVWEGSSHQLLPATRALGAPSEGGCGPGTPVPGSIAPALLLPAARGALASGLH